VQLKKKSGSISDICCESTEPKDPPSHSKQVHRIRRIRGQLDGVERMIEDRRYCPDIIIQVQAIRSALSALESKLLEEHLQSCVKDAFLSSDDKNKNSKIEEILKLIRRS
jgi:CsoR family transcriptional regulator, copper-sensing transcriptional repressor